MSADATKPDLRANLEGERASLQRQLAELGYGADAPSYDSNFADSSQVTAERGEVEALAASLLETLGQVEHALAKFDTSAYGTCESCGGEIAAARLEARPEARYCISCAAARR